MANTKKMDQASRRNAKKEMRKKNKALFATLTRKEKQNWLKFEGGGFKKYLASLAKEKETASGEAKPAPAPAP